MFFFRPLPWEYGVRNLLRRPGRSALTWAGLTTVTLLILLVVGFVRGFPLVGAWLCTFPLVGLLAVLWLARAHDTRRDFGFIVAAAAFIVSVVATFGADANTYSASGYDAALMVAAGLKNAKDTSRKGMLAGLTAATQSGFEGASGALTFKNRDATVPGVPA